MNDVSQRQKLTGEVTKVDSNATVPNGVSNDTANNNDSPISASIATTSFPDIITTVDITTAVQSTDLSLASRLATEIVPDTTPKITSTTTRIPANSDTNEQNTTAPIVESPGTNVSDNTTITNTPVGPNISNALMLFNVSTIEASTNADITPDTLPFTESTSANVRAIESMDTTSSSTIEMMITDISTPVSLNLISTDMSDITTSFSTIESVIPPETTTMSIMNNLSENIEMNTVQQYDETTEMKNIVENVEISTIRQFDATVPSQTMETTSTTESITTEEMSNNIIEMQTTEAPVVTSTFRTPFIDIAQNILSRLQGNFSTAETSIQKLATITTTSSNLFTTTLETTTNRPEQETNTQSTMALATELSITGDRSNDQKINTEDMASSSMIQNTRDSSINTEVATVSRLADLFMKNNSRLSNDTLLTELMTIAKTLFSEEMNETQQSLLMPDQIFNVDTTINPDIINNFIQTDGMMENDDKSRLVFSNETSETTDVSSTELSTTLENTSERIDVVTIGDETEESPNRGIPTLGSEISLMELNPAQPTDIQNSIDVGDIITTLQIFLFSDKDRKTSNIILSISMSSELTINR